MKKLRFTAFALIIALSVLLISGCSKPKYEKLTFDWVDDDIKAITLRKEMNFYEITDKNDIKKLIDYITDADIISKEEHEITLGWTYGINITLQDDENYWLTISDSGVRWNNNSETQTICTLETDYFKPLIEIMDSNLLKVYQ